MPYLIDGNNLLHALKKAGSELPRSGLCALLSALSQRPPRVAARRETVAPADRRRSDGTRTAHAVTVVFDGPAPQGALAKQIQTPGVRVLYAAPEKADEVIVRLIAADTAPRRLIVVSTDREIRKAARRRRCTSRLSEEFIDDLLRATRPGGFTSPAEPPQKYQGLSADQTRQWLTEFGYPPEDDEGDDEEEDDDEDDGEWDDDDQADTEWGPRR
ncbi:MAG: NYN domain-containing protein [Phycisphaerae bacterium]|nr:NYN domain-containing protein [Phycisphaerae bacterium]